MDPTIATTAVTIAVPSFLVFVVVSFLANFGTKVALGILTMMFSSGEQGLVGAIFILVAVKRALLSLIVALIVAWVATSFALAIWVVAVVSAAIGLLGLFVAGGLR